MNISNADNIQNSLQISNLSSIGGAHFRLGRPFLIKNISSTVKTIKVIMAGSNAIVETTFQPGWNPELVQEVVNETTNLQAGY